MTSPLSMSLRKSRVLNNKWQVSAPNGEERGPDEGMAVQATLDIHTVDALVRRSTARIAERSVREPGRQTLRPFGR